MCLCLCVCVCVCVSPSLCLCVKLSLTLSLTLSHFFLFTLRGPATPVESGTECLICDFLVKVRPRDKHTDTQHPTAQYSCVSSSPLLFPTSHLNLNLLQELDNYLESPSTVSTIVGYLEDVCHLLPSGDQSACKTFIDQFGEQLVDWIAGELSSNEICNKILNLGCSEQVDMFVVWVCACVGVCV